MPSPWGEGSSSLHSCGQAGHRCERNDEAMWSHPTFERGVNNRSLGNCKYISPLTESRMLLFIGQGVRGLRTHSAHEHTFAGHNAQVTTSGPNLQTSTETLKTRKKPSATHSTKKRSLRKRPSSRLSYFRGVLCLGWMVWGPGAPNTCIGF